MFYKIGFYKIYRKHLCQNIFLNKVAGLQGAIFWEKERQTDRQTERQTTVEVFSCEICNIFQTTYFIKHFRATASVFWKSNLKLHKKEHNVQILVAFPSLRTHKRMNLAFIHFKKRVFFWYCELPNLWITNHIVFL